MELKFYEIIEKALEEGIAYGFRRAYKHSDSPSEEILKEYILHAMMTSLDEIIQFKQK